MQPVRRPLSPHLQIYRPQLTSVLSIMHRMTGMALALGQLMLVIWLVTLVTNIQWFEGYQRFWHHPMGSSMLVGLSFSFFYHLMNGLRHLLWDSGRGFDLATVYKTGYGVIIVTAVATAVTWFIILTS